MSIRDIIVQVDVASAGRRYAIAARLAARSGGALGAVFLRTSLINQYINLGTIGYLPADDLQRLIREHNEGQTSESKAAFAALSAAASAAGVRAELRELDGDTPEALVAEARRADLAVMPPPSAHPRYNAHGSAVDAALGGTPTLIVPETPGPNDVGANVVVAWNGSREASRALRDAGSLLAAGARVTVVSVRARGAGREPDAGLARHLSALGCAVAWRVFDDGADAQDHIAAVAREVEADLIVMGLYGHARMQEFVLGGASRALLAAPPAPLLVAH